MTPPANKTRAAEIIVAVVAAAWFLLLSNRGINMADEGVTVGYGWEVSQGLITYRDYFVPVAPLGFEIQAVLIRLFGPYLVVGRLYAALQGIIMALVFLRLGRRYFEYPVSVLPALVCIPYSVSLCSFPNYNLDSAFFFLLAAFFFDERLHGRGGGAIFAGAFSACLAALAKQSLVPAAVILTGTAVALANRGRPDKALGRDAALAALGLALPALALFLRFAVAHALEEAWMCLTGLNDMKRVLLWKFLPGAFVLVLAALVGVRVLIALARRFPARSFGLGALPVGASILVLVLFPAQVSVPLISGVTALSLLLFVRSDGRDQAGVTLFRVYGILFFLFSILSGLDLGHVVIAAGGSFFFVGLFFSKLRLSRGTPSADKALGLLAAASMVLVWGGGIYLDLAVPQMAHTQGPRWKDTSPVNISVLAGMRTSPEQARVLEDTVDWIKQNSKPGEKIFVYPWDILLYYFSDRLPATYDTFLYFEIFNRPILIRVLRDLEKNKPRIAVVLMEGDKIQHKALAGEATAMEAYLRAHYAPGPRFGYYQIMLRKQDQEGP